MLLDGITSAGDDPGPVNVEGDEQVGHQQAAPLPGGAMADWDFAQHNCGGRRAKVAPQGRLVGRVVKVDGVLHVVPWREFGERFGRCGAPA